MKKSDFKDKSLHECLNYIQVNLKSPKDKKTDFGSKYSYRNVEDIYSAVKPLLELTGCTMNVSDTIKQIGERFYIQSIATISKNGESESSIGYAREGQEKKGMDVAQITGSCSSYSRKYSISGLFILDNTGVQDIDAMDNSYYPTQDMIARFADLYEHKCFVGKKTEVKERWKSCHSHEQSESCLKKMKATIDQYEQNYKEVA